VTLVDTGEKTMTGGRLKRIRDYLGNSTFCLTYGDGVSDVNIRELITFHHQQGALATVTAVQQLVALVPSIFRPIAHALLTSARKTPVMGR